jgi:hypothetical protein
MSISIRASGLSVGYKSLSFVRRFLFGVSLLLIAIGASGCLPAVVIVDRASVIEEESAGQWADIEQAFDLLHADFYPSLDPGLDPAVSSLGAQSAVLPGGALRPDHSGAHESPPEPASQSLPQAGGAAQSQSGGNP